MEPHSSILAWKIPWMEEPGRLQSMGSGRVGHDWATSLSVFPFMHWRSKWQPTPVFLPGESQGWRSLVGCRLWGCTESDMTEVTSQANKFKKGIVRIRKDLSTYTVWSHMCKPGRWNVLSFSFFNKESREKKYSNMFILGVWGLRFSLSPLVFSDGSVHCFLILTYLL